MADHRRLFEAIQKRLGMFVQKPSYETLASLVLGYDLALDGGLLHGFREWLITRLDWGNNLA